MKIRVYDMAINTNDDETGVDINSFVDAPAHISSFELYANRKATFSIDAEKRIVTGVFIMANFLIYRNDRQLGEHFVKFSPEVIWQIRNKFFKKGYNVNTNVMHETMVKGAILVDSYIVHSTDPKFPKVPEILASQKVTDGSWVGSYYIENEQLWQDCKNGVFKGFSVEGYFDKIRTNIKTKTSMKTGKKASFFKNIFGDNHVEETMSEATTVDGTVIFYDGELKEKSIVQIEVDGVKVPAPAGDHQLELDGKTFAITLDDKGAVVTMEEVTAMSEEATLLSEAIKKVVADATGKFAAMTKEINDLKEEIKVLKSSDEFQAKGKKSGEGSGKSGFKKLLN
jgi:hypothetical protein